MPTKYREWWRIAEFQIFGAEIWNAREPNSRLYRGTQSWKSQNLMNINDGSDLLRLTSTDANCIFSPVITGSDWDRHCLFLWLILELFVLIVCHFTEMDLDSSIDFCRKSFYSRLCCQCVLGLTCTFAKLIDLCLLLFSGAVFGKTERNKSLVNMHNSCISWSCYKLFSFVRWSTLSVLLNVVPFIVHV